jgi:hypothetical protein
MGGEAFYGLGVQGFGVLFLLFPSVAPTGKYYVWSAECLPNKFGVGSWQVSR